MNRRNVLIVLGTTAAGAGIVFGSGAFTQASADRDVTIRVDEDSKALLGLVPGDLKSVREEDGKLEIDSDLLGGGDGFNKHAEVEIGDITDDGDVDEEGEEAFKIVNNFDQEIKVTVDVEHEDEDKNVQPEDEGELRLVLTDPETGETARSSERIEKTLNPVDEAGNSDEPGYELLAALEFDTDEEGVEGKITFTAEPT